MLERFSSKTIKELGYYVYVYSDPDTHKPFYVGKGKANRVFDHLKDTKESEKVKTQEEIKEFIKNFRKQCEEDVVTKFLKEVDRYCIGWCE